MQLISFYYSGNLHVWDMIRSLHSSSEEIRLLSVWVIIEDWLRTFWYVPFGLYACPFLTSTPRVELLGRTVMSNSTKQTSKLVLG